MEPPAKRRRQGTSPFNSSDPLGLEPETDDDTAPHHDHVETEDDGYQLAIKRMQASQKFQATFAHIFEKYSQNFDGIGDEIDMETGEIVVNNGHLSHMRHEADIGGRWTDNPTHEPIGVVDEDDGFVLEDFIDGFSDDEQDEPQAANQDGNESEASNHESSKTDKEEEEVVREGPATATEKNALVPANNAGAVALPQNLQVGQVGNPASFFTNLYGSLLMGFMPALVPMPPGNAFPQLTNGVPLPANIATPSNEQGNPFPIMFNPWATTGLLPPQSWGQIGASMQLPQNWGQPNAPTPPQLPPIPSPEKSKGERYKFPVQRGDTSIWAPDSRQEDDNSPPKRRGRTPKSRNRKVDHIWSSPSRNEKSSTNEELMQVSDTDHENRRVSGRVRKQVEYMGKISWLEVENNAIEQASNQQPTTDSEDSSACGDDELASELNTSTVESVQSSQSSEKLKHISESKLGRVIPDSQDSATPPASSAPQPSQSSQAKDTAVTKNSTEKQTSVFALSDDEAPIVHQKTTNSGISNTSTKPIPEASSPEKAIDMTTNVPLEVPPTSEPPKKRPRGRPRKRPLDSPGDAPDQNYSANPAKRATGPARVRCQREIKWLQKSLSESNNSMLPLEATNKNEETAQIQTRGSPKALRSTQPKASPKPTLDTMNEPPEQEEEQGQGQEPNPSTPIPDPPAADETPTPTVGHRSVEVETPPKSPEWTPPVGDETLTNAEDLPPLPTSEETPIQLSPSTKEHTPVPIPVPNTPQKPTRTSRPRSSKPQTPRHTAIRTSQAPSSRRSLLSLVSNQDSDSESDKDLDELGHSHSFRPSPFGPRSAGTSTRKTWRSSALTREIYRTPVKKRREDPVSPSSVIRTPGGTIRTCGVDGYQCGRDFCFTCL